MKLSKLFAPSPKISSKELARQVKLLVMGGLTITGLRLLLGKAAHGEEAPQANIAAQLTRYPTPTLYATPVDKCDVTHQWYVIGVDQSGKVASQSYVGCDAQMYQQVEDTPVPAPLPTPPVCTPFGSDDRC